MNNMVEQEHRPMLRLEDAQLADLLGCMLTGAVTEVGVRQEPCGVLTPVLSDCAERGAE
jgi:hypothetical protein